MPRSLADGKTKFTVLTVKPEDPKAPTADELNAGIHMECNVLDSDFLWGATDSDKIAEKPLCAKGNQNALGPSNFQGGATVFREFGEDGAPDPDDDTPFETMKRKGTELYGYARKTGKDADQPWGDSDEIYLGAKFATDEPQPPSDLGGYIKYRVPFEIQDAYPFIEVAAGSGG